jgi:two-component sensor histidine kinase
VSLEIDANDVFLSIDAAVPCGLIINELVSNALKHAFVDGRAGKVYISLRPDHDHRLILTVGDNGVGFPDDVDYHDTESLGMQLVNTLVDQLDGTIDLHCNGGTQFEIAFDPS